MFFLFFAIFEEFKKNCKNMLLYLLFFFWFERILIKLHLRLDFPKIVKKGVCSKVEKDETFSSCNKSRMIKKLHPLQNVSVQLTDSLIWTQKSLHKNTVISMKEIIFRR
jgi:hypothetical protein